MPSDPRALLRDAPMTGKQWAAVAVTVALSALDGYDVLIATLAAPVLAGRWGLGHGAVGAFLSAGLVGMALGSLLIAPLADLIGRRPLIFACLALMAIGTAASGAAPGLPSLIACRVVTGLGIGAMIPVINPLATEFANERRRDLAVSLMAMGYPLGGVLGGLIGVTLLARYDWPLLFEVGAVAGVALLPVVWRWLPEPASFLIERGGDRALERLNGLLRRFDHAEMAALPARAGERPAAPLRRLFAAGQADVTATITLVNLLYVVAVYFVLSWMPQFVADAGFSAAQAAGVSLLASISGIVFGTLFGWLAEGAGARRAATAVFLCFAAAIVAFGRAPADLTVLRGAGAAVGAFLFAGMSALHTLVSRGFADATRASGAGFVLGIGRAGSAIAPLAVGVVLAAGATRGAVSLGMALLVAVAAALLALRHRTSVHSERSAPLAVARNP